MANLDQISSCCLFIHASVGAVLRRGCVTVLFDGCERKYDNDSSEVVRSTVLTFTPRRAVSETGAKLSTALIPADITRSEEHTSELQSRRDLVCRLLLEKKKKKIK